MGLQTPVYETTKEGPSHEPSFRSAVVVNDVRYKSLPGFFNRKAAEQSAAEVALIELAKLGQVNPSISQPVVPKFPSKLFFFCEVEPGSGGETPIVLSHIVYERMKHRHPEFVEKLEQHGLIYTRVLGEEDDPSSPIGRGWKSTFLTDDKNLAVIVTLCSHIQPSRNWKS
ncbi:uncharacterized protein LOC123218490 isoform X2 [Mangifera indica]|nr:uncharacterized protein LOC123218490 isoform X2 [Mangifera indica]